MSRFYRGVLDVVDSTKFWAVVALIGVLVVTFVNVAHNRQQATQNARLIREHDALLSYFCELAAVQDAVYVQLIKVDEQTLRDPTALPAARDRAQQRLNLYNIAHQEFSNTRACQQVE